MKLTQLEAQRPPALLSSACLLLLLGSFIFSPLLSNPLQSLFHSAPPPGLLPARSNIIILLPICSQFLPWTRSDHLSLALSLRNI